MKIDPVYFWVNTVFLTIGTITIRGSLIALSARVKISNQVKELFSFIPAAILPAFIAPAVFFHPGHVTWLFEKERLFVLVLATVVCFLWKSTLLTVAFGLITLYLLTQFA